MSITNYGIKLIIHSQTSTVQPLKFKIWSSISPCTLQALWLFINAGTIIDTEMKTGNYTHDSQLRYQGKRTMSMKTLFGNEISPNTHNVPPWNSKDVLGRIWFHNCGHMCSCIFDWKPLNSDVNLMTSSCFPHYWAISQIITSKSRFTPIFVMAIAQWNCRYSGFEWT